MSLSYSKKASKWSLRHVLEHQFTFQSGEKSWRSQFFSSFTQGANILFRLRQSSALRHQRGCLLWKSLRLLRCVQKPETSLAAQHVCCSTGCERYFNLYLQHAFFSCFSVPRQVDFRCKFLPISRINTFHVFNDFSSHYGINRCQPIFLHRQTRKVHRVIQQTKDSRVHCRCVLRGPCWICASTFFHKRWIKTKTRTGSMHVRI